MANRHSSFAVRAIPVVLAVVVLAQIVWLIRSYTRDNRPVPAPATSAVSPSAAGPPQPSGTPRAVENVEDVPRVLAAVIRLDGGLSAQQRDRLKRPAAALLETTVHIQRDLGAIVSVLDAEPVQTLLQPHPGPKVPGGPSQGDPMVSFAITLLEKKAAASGATPQPRAEGDRPFLQVSLVAAGVVHLESTARSLSPSQARTALDAFRGVQRSVLQSLKEVNEVVESLTDAQRKTVLEGLRSPYMPTVSARCLQLWSQQ